MNKMMKREDDDDSWRLRQFIQLFFVATNRYELLAFFLAVYEFWILSIRRRSLDFLFDFSGSLELANTRCFAGSKDDCDLLLELQGTPASSRFLDACFVKVAATCYGGEQLE